MSYKRQSLKNASFCLLASLAAGAVFVVGAQAAPAWKIGGASLVGLELILSKSFLVQLGIPGVTTIHWSSAETHKTLHSTSLGDGILELIKGLVKGAEGACSVVEPATIKYKDKLVEHAGVVYDVYEPLEGTAFTNIKVTGAECPVKTPAGGEPLTGSFASVVPSPEAVSQPLKPVSSATQKLLNEKLELKLGMFYGKQSASLEGTALESLIGKNVGNVWGAN